MAIDADFDKLRKEYSKLGEKLKKQSDAVANLWDSTMGSDGMHALDAEMTGKIEGARIEFDRIRKLLDEKGEQLMNLLRKRKR